MQRLPHTPIQPIASRPGHAPAGSRRVAPIQPRGGARDVYIPAVPAIPVTGIGRSPSQLAMLLVEVAAIAQALLDALNSLPAPGPSTRPAIPNFLKAFLTPVSSPVPPSAPALLPPAPPAAFPVKAPMPAQPTAPVALAPSSGLAAPAVPPGPSTGAVRQVKAGDNLQAIVDAAQPGDTLVLEAGATFMGPIRLPFKEGQGTITLTSSALDKLPGAGGRVSPSDSANMPKIIAPGRGEPAIFTEARAHDYALVGLEVTQADESAMTYDLVRVGSGDASQTSLDQVPQGFLFDRCYLHGLPNSEVKRGIAMNGANITVTGSHVSDFKGKGYDTQALSGWNGPGPFAITNNFLQGAGENVMFGGADPTIPGLVPSDITITGNHFHKPTAWRGVWTVKNLFELKNARRVVVDRNVFENNWADGQNGNAILFTVRNQDGKAPWSTVEDVEFTRNVVLHSASGVNILGKDNIRESQRTSRIRIAGNLFADINGPSYGGAGHFLTIGEGAADVVVDHNTIMQTGKVINAYGAPSTGFVFTNNLAPTNEYGIHGDAQSSGNASIAAYFPGATVRGNALAGAPADAYPPDNTYPGSVDDFRFESRLNGNYRLAGDSPFRAAGTDGKDTGADMNYLPVLPNA